MAALLARLSRLADRRRWWIVGIWLVAFAAAAPLAGKVADRLSSGGFEVPGSQSIAINEIYDRAGRGAQPFTFVVQAPDVAAARARAGEIRRALGERFPRVTAPAGLAVSRDGRSVTFTAYAPVTQNEALKLAGDLKEALERTDGATRTWVTGPGSTYETFQDVTTEDIASAEAIGFPLVLIVLVALFGALAAALLPISLALVAVTVTLALVALIADRTEVSVYAQSMVSMIGIGVAVDYSLFILARFREELAAGRDKAEATAQAMRTSGTAVVFSGLTVIVSLGTVWIVPVRAVQSMAGAAMLVVAVAVVAAATLLPALLHLVGRNVDRGSVRLPGAARRERASRGFWTAFAARIMARPWAYLIAASGVLIILALPALALRTLNVSTGQLPRDEPVVIGTQVLSDQITGPGLGRAGQLVAVARPRAGDADAVAEAMRGLAGRIAAIPGIQGAKVVPLGGAITIEAPLSVDPESLEAVDRIVPAARRLAASDPELRSGARVDVGGLSAFQGDLNRAVSDHLWPMIGALLTLSYVLLLLMLRSVLLPLKAVFMNLLSIGAAAGVLVAVFQWGWLDWLGYDSLGTISPLTLPLVITITFGLSMDYEVFLLSRIKERYDAHGDNTRAVAEGLAGSARVITSAAIIMVGVFGAFVLTGIPAIKEIGLGLAIAILIDATITRLVLVPATMRLLGDWNWWLPGWLERALPWLAHEPGEAAADPAP